ncbi:MAG TPA: sugar phosphate isomerase/epimerase family protein [Bryobacteraceae bacterium]|nr:sugar phosphate isomerase/epimerase family protein [Bryobacteraceae bacterium]
MLPTKMTHAERFQLALDCGFQSMECGTETDEATAASIKEASVKTGMPIHSVMNMAHWKYPLNSPDQAVVEESLKGMRVSLHNAKLWGASTVLLVPAVVNAELSYKDAWTRSQIQVKKLIPVATELKVIIGIENVWNKFLLSPLEMANYVDSFKSPWVKAYFDVGNILLYGFPQDWIRTLGTRICKIHLKDFSFRPNPQIKKRVADFVNLRDGDLDWKAIHTALAEIGYKGDATVELPGGDEAYLKDLSGRVDKILEGV